MANGTAPFKTLHQKGARMKRKIALLLLPLGTVGLLFLLVLSLILGGSTSINVSANAPNGVSKDQLATAQEVVTRIKKEVPNATTNGLAALLGCFQAESGERSKSAEGDFMAYPVGAQGASDDETYNNRAWSSIGGAAIYGAGSIEATSIQERGLGLGQYTNGRNLALQAYAEKVGKPWWDLDTQLDYILNVDGDAALLKKLVAEQGDVPTLTTAFVKQYERGGAGGLSLRIAYAQAWANWLLNPSQNSESTKGNTRLNGLIGQKVGSGQCYALSSWYVQQISGFTLQGMAASAIGSDNAAAFQQAGWTVISNPTAADLKVGAIVCWHIGSNSRSIYGHTAIINSISGNSFVTYDQNWNGNQTVELYHKTWDDSMTFVILPPQK